MRLLVLLALALLTAKPASGQVQPILGPEPNEYYFRAENQAGWLITWVATPGREFLFDRQLGRQKALALWVEALWPAGRLPQLRTFAGSAAFTLSRREVGFVDFELLFESFQPRVSLRFQKLPDSTGDLFSISLPVLGRSGEALRLSAGRLNRPPGLGDTELKVEYAFRFQGFLPELETVTVSAANENAFNFIEVHVTVANNDCCLFTIQSGLSF